jgi:Terminase RNaseH-like domain
MSPDQHRMIDDPHRVLWIGTGTKTGKTIAEAQWLIEGIGAGERCAWVGPYYKRTRTGFDHIASAFADAAKAGVAHIRKNEMRIDLPATGGVLECFSGDNPDSIFGEAFDRVAVDEAGRMKAGVLPAVLSTTTATRGRLSIAFNLDQARSHWAVRGFLKARAGEDPDHGFVFLKTSDSPYVDTATIDLMRRTLPSHVFAALYDGEIQENGAGVFRNWRACVKGSLAEPEPLHQYVAGVDLARTFDWTVVCVMDVRTRRLVAFERFHGEPWKVQRERIKAIVRRYNNAHLFPDATGVGDPNVEELVRDGLQVTPYVFTGPSKRDLVETLIVSIENREVSIPYFADGPLEPLAVELDAFEYEVRERGHIGYAAAEGFHDDAAIALALANWGLTRAPSYPRLGDSGISVGSHELMADSMAAL